MTTLLLLGKEFDFQYNVVEHVVRIYADLSGIPVEELLDESTAGAKRAAALRRAKATIKAHSEADRERKSKAKRALKTQQTTDQQKDKNKKGGAEYKFKNAPPAEEEVGAF